MATPTSIGGIANRGVPEGLALIDQAVAEGNHWFARSDIQNFFTRIPKAKVAEFIRDAVSDRKFSDLFDRALATNLENVEELEERNVFKLFPDPEIGVAQGSALSALAGNIVLRQFDQQMNDRGITCVRYIDDFILLGPSEKTVLAAFRSARMQLAELGMDVYGLDNSKARSDGKADHGNIHDGTDVLGYRISGRSRQPSKAAQRKFIGKLDAVVDEAKREMKAAVNGDATSHLHRYHQSMVQLHRIAWGWSQAFRHSTATHVFEHLDREIDKRIRLIQTEARELVRSGDARVRRRVFGVHLLVDTEEYPLPKAP